MKSPLSSLLKSLHGSRRTAATIASSADVKWVFCGGMLRSGSTLQYNIASEIVELCGAGHREVWVEDHDDYFSKTSGDAVKVFKSHILSHPIAERLNSGRGVALISFRDVRDATASWQAKTRKKMDIATGMEFAELAIKQLEKWEKLPTRSVLISKYETVIDDLDAEVARVASWLGVSLERAAVRKISNAVSVPSMAKSLIDSHDVTVSPDNTWNTRTLVHMDHLNGGDVGRYKHELSPKLVDALTSTHRNWLSVHGYDPK